jgi:hypothetical protein
MSLYDGKLDNNKIMGQFYIMLIVEKLANITISCVLDWIGIQVYWNRDNPDDSYTIGAVKILSFNSLLMRSNMINN